MAIEYSTLSYYKSSFLIGKVTLRMSDYLIDLTIINADDIFILLAQSLMYA